MDVRRMHCLHAGQAPQQITWGLVRVVSPEGGTAGSATSSNLGRWAGVVRSPAERDVWRVALCPPRMHARRASTMRR